MFFTEQSEGASKLASVNINMKYFQMSCNELSKTMTGSFDSYNMCGENAKRISEHLDGFVQKFFGEILPTMNSEMLVA